MALKLEQPIRVHLLAFSFVILIGFLAKLNTTEWAAIILCSTLVIVAELLNTAIEKLCDFVHAKDHPAIKYIKDVAAAAVMISATGAVIVGILLFSHALHARAI